MTNMRPELAGFIPELAIPKINEWIESYRVSVEFVKPRRSKLGDHRFDRTERRSQITLNRDRSIYRNLITLVHELAHAHVRQTCGMEVPAHGKEWKCAYREMMLQIKELGVFPYDLEIAIERHFRSPRFTDTTDVPFTLILNQYDDH